VILSVDSSRETAENLSTDLPVAPGRWKASVWTFSEAGRKFVVKDVRRTSVLYRYTLGRWGLRREARFYGRLADLEFIPSCVGRLDRDSLILEWVAHVSLLGLARARGRPPADFCDQLQACVDQIHERGIVHLDLRHRANILISADGTPRLIDFEIAMFLGPMVRLLSWIDRSAVTKYRMRYSPNQVSDAEAMRYARFNRIRRWWRRCRLWPRP
jgi:serine/threonine protein kinase